MLGLCIWLVLVTPIISLSTVAEDILFQFKEQLQRFKVISSKSALALLQASYYDIVVKGRQ